MKRFIRQATLSGLILFSCAAWAEESFDLLSVYELAVKHDDQLAAARASLKSSEESLPQSRAQLLPSLQLSADTTANRNKNLFPGTLTKGVKHDNFNSHGWEATLVQPVFKPASWLGLDRAEVMTKAARLKFAAEQQNLMIRVASVYFAVLEAQDNLDTLDAEERAVKRQLDQTKQRYAVGLIPRTDVYEAQAAYDSTRVNKIEGENKLQVAFQKLWTITSKKIDKLGQLRRDMPVQSVSQDREAPWLEKGTHANLSVQIARLNAEAAQKNINIQRAGFAPELDVTFSFTHGVNYSVANAPQNFKNNQTAVGLAVTWPLFEGGITLSNVRKASYDFEKNQYDFEFARRNISQSIRTLFMTVNSDVERIQARQLGIISAKSALKATESGYEVGTRSIVDVLNAQQKYYSSKRDYRSAHYTFLNNSLALKQAIGVLNVEDLKALNHWIVKK